MQKVFSYEKRVEAIKLYTKEEMTPEKIAKIFRTDHSVIERWIRIYKVHGYAGLNIKPYNMVYDQAFKDEVIKVVLENHITRTTAAVKYNLSHSTITRWCVEYTRGIRMNGKKNIISAQEAAELREKY